MFEKLAIDLAQSAIPLRGKGRNQLIPMYTRITARQAMTLTLLVLLLPLATRNSYARPTSPGEAEMVVAGWLKADARPLGTVIGRRVMDVETFANDADEPIYHIVYLQPSGFVIVSADDLVEPIIGFADDGSYDASLENPLATLVINDLGQRVVAVRENQESQSAPMILALSETQRKWNRFITLAEQSENGLSMLGLSWLSDVRVAPLIQTKWHQGDICGDYCFNYYTPDHYSCGCVATAMAQLMRYHRYPEKGIGRQHFTIEVQGTPQTAYTRGGDGLGGPYDWHHMVPEPGCATGDTQRKAIGAICSDAGISIGVDYGPDGSSGDVLKTEEALTGVFQYSNAVLAYNKGENIGSGLSGMINPNLDYGRPVILGLRRENGGHAVLCDGYGYSARTLYHHLNMGWAGADDAWYNLPDVDAYYSYTAVAACVYNIFVRGKGEIISGRVTDVAGRAIAGAIITAGGAGGAFSAYTNAKGIYALATIPSGCTYTIRGAKPGYVFTSQVVRTGTSRQHANTSGNKWAVDFVAATAGDCDADGDVDSADFAIFAASWGTGPQSAAWNGYCDMNSPADGFIDTLDLAVLAENWLTGVK
jgi:hypothetical protein